MTYFALSKPVYWWNPKGKKLQNIVPPESNLLDGNDDIITDGNDDNITVGGM